MRGSSAPPESTTTQAGVFTAEQARDAGYSTYRIRRLVRDGRWVVVVGSVYAESSTRLSTASLAWAASLASVTGSVVSHQTAARLWGYSVPDDPEVHVIVPRDSRRQRPGLRTHRVEIAERDVDVVGGIVCTSRLRTAVDCLLWLPEEAGRGLAVDALRRGRLTVSELRSELQRTGQRHGLARAWSVLDDVGRGAHSEGEVRLHRLLTGAGIGGWEANVALHDDRGLIGIVDVLFGDAALVLEMDGRAHHSDDVAFQRDRSRQNRLVAQGYTVLRFTWDDIVTGPDEVVALVRRAIADAAYRSRATTSS